MPQDTPDLIARADLCRFVAACYYQPAAEFTEERLFDSMESVARRLDPDLARAARSLGAAFRALPLEELLVDYTRLFLGPGTSRARPYGSVWLTGESELMQDSTLAVAALYAEADFDIDEDFRELPDHVAVELEFLYLLLHGEAQAQLAGDSAAAETVVQRRRRFLDEHLGRWIERFATAVEAGAETAFYRELAPLTLRAVRLAGCAEN